MELKKKRRELILKKYFFELVQIIAGTFLMAVGVSLFLLPNQLSSGGFTGIATILYYLLKLPMGMSILALNIPLFILSFIKKGRRFVVRGILGTVFLSIFIDVLDQYKALTRRSILSMYLWWYFYGARDLHYIKSKCIYWWNRHASLCN